MDLTFNRKLQSLDNKTGNKIKDAVRELLEIHEEYKNSYFWNPAGHAHSRRSREFENYLVFYYQGKEYEIFQEYSESCNNCYWDQEITVNGNKKDIRALKKLLK